MLKSKASLFYDLCRRKKLLRFKKQSIKEIEDYVLMNISMIKDGTWLLTVILFRKFTLKTFNQIQAH
jgi:hypothetical protein